VVGADRDSTSPRVLDDVTWHQQLLARLPAIRGEWDEFVAGGGRLPRIEDVLAESQGNEGSWRAGLLVANVWEAWRKWRRAKVRRSA
jgi:hypothetical protein